MELKSLSQTAILTLMPDDELYGMYRMTRATWASLGKLDDKALCAFAAHFKATHPEMEMSTEQIHSGLRFALAAKKGILLVLVNPCPPVSSSVFPSSSTPSSVNVLPHPPP